MGHWFDFDRPHIFVSGAMSPTNIRGIDSSVMWHHQRIYGVQVCHYGPTYIHRELYFLKVVKLVFILLVVNYVVDLMMCVNYIGVV
jgi:hypothetical protein